MPRRGAAAQPEPPASEEVDVEALLREAEAAEAAAQATLPTLEQERVIIKAAEALAGSEAGVPAKSRAVVLRLESKWLDFLEKHGVEYSWDKSVGPSMEMAKHFQTWGFFHRTNFSTVGLDGMGDSWGQLAVPYLLPKYRYVFVKLGYTGWAELATDALHAMCCGLARWKDQPNPRLNCCAHVARRAGQWLNDHGSATGAGAFCGVSICCCCMSILSRLAR